MLLLKCATFKESTFKGWSVPIYVYIYIYTHIYLYIYVYEYIVYILYIYIYYVHIIYIIYVTLISGIENGGQGREYQNWAKGWVNFTKSAQYPTGSKETQRK